MPAGFFPKSKLLATKAPTSLIAKCGACGLYKTCKSPKMPPSGSGKRRILLVGEGPELEEDRQGKHFIHKQGKYIEETLRRAGVNMREDCILTNSTICSAPDGVRPTAEQMDYCRPNLLKTIEQHSPDVIIPMGDRAIQSLLATVYKENDLGGIFRWAGFQIPCQKLNAWICPTFEPHYPYREEKNPVPRKLFYQHLDAAVKLQGKPWDVVPDYGKQIERIVDHRKAAKAILELIASGDPLAFDYECTCLKPEYAGAAIVSCSVSNGERTIAYPWIGSAIEATLMMIRSDNPKIASNLKYEERWTRWYFRKRVKNWKWDTMNSAHCIDNRPNTTSIKFQAFIHLGTEAYDEHIKPFLQAKRGKQVNQILQEIDLDQLLLYNGLDSLLEWKVAMIQAELVGTDLYKEKG